MGKDTFEVQKNWKIKNINFNYCNDQDKRVETSSDQQTEWTNQDTVLRSIRSRLLESAGFRRGGKRSESKHSRLRVNSSSRCSIFQIDPPSFLEMRLRKSLCSGAERLSGAALPTVYVCVTAPVDRDAARVTKGEELECFLPAVMGILISSLIVPFLLSSVLHTAAKH